MRMKIAVLIIAALALCFGVPPSFGAEPIKIGAFFALSGPAANIGTPTKLVAQMVVDQINKEGGINGRPIELIVGDTESDPAKAAVIAKKFIFSDKVAAIIGPTSTAEGMSVKKIVEEAGVPTFMTVGGDPVIMGGNLGAYTYVFKSPQRSSTAARKLYGYLKAKGLTKVALFTASDSFGKDGLGWLEKLAPEFGITFTAKEVLRPLRHRHDRPAHQDQELRAPGHRHLDHRPGRVHRGQEQGAAGDHHPPVPVPRAPRPEVHRAGGQGLRGGSHAGHQAHGGRLRSPTRTPRRRSSPSSSTSTATSTNTTRSSPSTRTRATPGTPSPSWPTP